MNYNSTANSIHNSAYSFQEGLRGVSSSNFDGIWAGSAHDNLTSNLDNALSNFKHEITQIAKFIDALRKLQDYKTAKERVDEINTELSTLDSVKDASTISSLELEKSNKETKMESLKSEIESVVSSITSFSSQDSVISV